MSRFDGWGRSARHGGLGLVAGLALAAMFGGGRVPTVGAQPTVAETAGMIALTTQSGGSSPVQWLYLIDTRNRSFAVYCVDPKNPKGAVKLEATRRYEYDLKLAEFNNQAPDVAAIEAMVGGNTRR